MTPLIALRKQQLQQRLAAGYSAPDLKEIAISLHTGRRGRVIRCYHRHVAREHLLPQCFPLRVRTYRRSALRHGSQSFYVVPGQYQVVRARLAAYVDASLPCRRYQLDTSPAADMHDEQRTPCFAGEQDGSLDGFEFGYHGPRSKIVAYLRSPLRYGALCQPTGDLIVFRVYRDDFAKFCGACHAFVERQVINRWEILYATIRHKRLETNDAAPGKLIELVQVSWYDTAPEGKVNERGGLRGGEFEVETGCIDRGRVSIERHIEEAGGAPGSQRTRPRGEPLPFSTPRLVEVYVRVNHPGKDM